MRPYMSENTEGREYCYSRPSSAIETIKLFE